MNGSARINDQNLKAQLAAQFNDFYLQTTSPSISQIGNYRIIKEIGEGAFGKVYLANHILLNVDIVLKCGLIDDPNIVREVYYHRQLKHENIVKLYEIIKTERHLWLVLEYCEGNELFYYIYEQRKLDIETCKKIFIQILNGIKYVHSLNLSHRDLKLENILLADRKKKIVKLTDFGFVREYNPLKRQFLSTVCGTTVYMAPELLKNEKYLGFSIDIWSLGIILFTMLYGEMPFDEDDDLKTKFKIIHEDPLYKDSIPQDAINLLKKILSKDPHVRPNLTEILNSPFLNDYNKNSDIRSRRSSLYNDNESIISINQYYKTNSLPFQSKIERHLLKKLEKLNINIDYLQHCVLNGESNSLTAFYELSLQQEFTKKKSRYLKEKKLRYYEAKKSLKKSRKKVKSALSLTDQNNTTNSQPLERIISSLSLTSNRNVSGGTQNGTSENPNKSNEYTPQQSQTQNWINSSTHNLNRNSMSNLNNSIQKDKSNNDVNNENLVGGSIKPDLSLNMTGSTSDSPRFQKTVSFFTDDEKRRTSNVTALSSIGSENLKKRSKNNIILNKLQFWKRNRSNTDGDIPNDLSFINNNNKSSNSLNVQNQETFSSSNVNSTVNQSIPTAHQNDILSRIKSDDSMDNDQPLQINIKPKSSSPSIDPNETNLERNPQRLSSPSSIKPTLSHNASNENVKTDHALVNTNLDSPSSPMVVETNVNGNDSVVIDSSPQDTPLELKESLVNELNTNSRNAQSAHSSNYVEFQSNGSDSPNVASPPTLESYYITPGSRQMRTRPSSVVSQVSQLSHLSQLSTMLSESELDILDETDTMDEEFDEDEGAYESSINMSQNEYPPHRYSSTGMTPNSSFSISINNTNNKPSNIGGGGSNIIRKPSYIRTLSSDASIVSSSTAATNQKQSYPNHNKKFSLSQLSSNSSEESLFMNNVNINNNSLNGNNHVIPMKNSQSKGGFFSTPEVPLPSKSNDLDSTLLPNPASLDFSRLLNRNGLSNGNRSPKQNKSSLMHPRLWSNRPASPKIPAINSGSPKSKKSEVTKNADNGFSTVSSYPLLFNSNQSGNTTSNNHNENLLNGNQFNSSFPIPRSHSPPISNKFNRLKMNNRLLRHKRNATTESINEIDESLPFEQDKSSHWHGVPSSINPADQVPWSTADNGKGYSYNTSMSGLNHPIPYNHTPRFTSGSVINEEEEGED